MSSENNWTEIEYIFACIEKEASESVFYKFDKKNTKLVLELIAKHLRGELTAAETEQLEQWLQSDPHNQQLFDKLSDNVLINHELEIYATSEKENRKPSRRF